MANFTGTVDERNISALLQGSQSVVNAGTSVEASQKAEDATSNGLEPSRAFASASKVNYSVNFEDHLRSMGQCQRLPASDMAQRRKPSGDTDGENLRALLGLGCTNPCRDSLSTKTILPETTTERMNFHSFDLNNVYDDSQDHLDNLGNSHLPVNSGTASLDNSLWRQHSLNKSSPPHPSGNSYSTSTQSPSSSSGEAQVSHSPYNCLVLNLFHFMAVIPLNF